LQQQHHSYLNTFIGSTFVARVAGDNAARSATPNNTAVTEPSVSGSAGFTSNSSVAKYRATANAPVKPNARPVNVNISVRENHACHLALLSPQSHSDADLVRSLGYTVRHHAINP
jgi:hypothetical protein